MAITDTHTPELDAARPEGQPEAVGFPAPKGIGAVIGTGDHKTIGRLYIGVSLAFGLLALALTAAFNLTGNDVTVLGSDNGFRAFTLGQLGLVLLFLMPLFIGIATVVVPLQVGASTIAFPRAAAAAFWAWLVSAGLFLLSYASSVGGGIGFSSADPKGVQLTFVALLGLGASLLLATVCVVTTIVALRTSGMHLDQVPLFSWSMLVAGGVWLLTVPVFLGNVVLILIDLKYGAPAHFGVLYKQWSQLAWFVTQPQVLAFAIPLLGVAGDTIVTFARARQPKRGAVLFGIGLFGAVSLGAYAQPFFFPGVYLQWVFVAQCATFALPVLILLGGFAMALRAGKVKPAGAALLALVSLLLLLIATVAAPFFAIGRLGLQYTPTAYLANNQALRLASAGSPIYTWGILALVVAAGAAAAVAGLAYWSPKIAGKKSSGGLTSLLALVFLVGGVLAGAPLLALGFANKFQSLADSQGPLFLAAAAGCALLILGVLIALISTLAARASVLGNGTTTEPDAWGVGQSLEWACDSPPAPGNFGTLAHVDSPEPLFDLAESGGAD